MADFPAAKKCTSLRAAEETEPGQCTTLYLALEHVVYLGLSSNTAEETLQTIHLTNPNNVLNPRQTLNRQTKAPRPCHNNPLPSSYHAEPPLPPTHTDTSSSTQLLFAPHFPDLGSTIHFNLPLSRFLAFIAL
jgi:hypothetical protein